MTDKYANLRDRLAALKLAGPVSTDARAWNAATDALDVELVAELLAERDAMVQAQPAAESPCACWPGRMCSRSAQCARDVQPAAVSDGQIRQLAIDTGLVYDTGNKLLTPYLDYIDLTRYVLTFARAILALRPQAVPMTIKAAPKLIGWRTENFLWETDDADKARNWEPNIGVLPIFEGDPNTKLGANSIIHQRQQVAPMDQEAAWEASPVTSDWEAVDAYMQGIADAEAHHGITAQAKEGGA